MTAMNKHLKMTEFTSSTKGVFQMLHAHYPAHYLAHLQATDHIILMSVLMEIRNFVF